MSDDFITEDDDLLNPDVREEAIEANRKRRENEINQEVQALERLQNAYKAVFDPEGPLAHHAKLIEEDLRRFCRVNQLTFHPTSSKIQDLQEGRREVWLRKQEFLELTLDELIELRSGNRSF